jgi:hypothetical protein
MAEKHNDEKPAYLMAKYARKETRQKAIVV